MHLLQKIVFKIQPQPNIAEVKNYLCAKFQFGPMGNHLVVEIKPNKTLTSKASSLFALQFKIVLFASLMRPIGAFKKCSKAIHVNATSRRVITSLCENMSRFPAQILEISENKTLTFRDAHLG